MVGLFSETDLAKFDLKKYARQGAATRAAELQAELAAIFRAFPDLRVPSGRGAAGQKVTGRHAARRRPAMSAAQKKAVSARMKKYWAERRKAKTTK